MQEENKGEVVIKGNKLTCPICTHAEFWSRETLMNTTGMSFFNLDWANRSAKNYICTACGYVFWFLKG
jgi:predicted nucleic-acid-binding Zn-ribbon protein